MDEPTHLNPTHSLPESQGGRVLLGVCLVAFVLSGLALAGTFVFRNTIVGHARGMIAAELEQRARAREVTLGGLFFRIEFVRSEEVPPDADADIQVEVETERSSRLGRLRGTAMSMAEAVGHADTVRQREAEAVAELENVIDTQLDRVMSGLIDNYRTNQNASGASVLADLAVGIIETAPPEVPRELAKSIVRRAAEENRAALDRWEGEVRGDYDGLTSGLIRELRRFSTFKTCLYGGLFVLITCSGSRARKLLTAPVVFLLLASFLTVACYIFLQDWSNMLLYGRYWGNGSMALTGIILLFLIDIYYMQGFITQAVVEVLSMLARTCVMVIRVLVPG